MAKLRATQEKVASYSGGRLGVAAVPGSGKTFTLSHLAARLVERLTGQGLADEQEVLIVTFANSAANSFKQRIATLLQQERGLLPYIGYRVRTLHGLAHDIVRERPALAGLSEEFQIIDESDSLKIINELTLRWLNNHPEFLLDYADGQFVSAEGDRLTIPLQRIGGRLVNVALRFINHAKDSQYQYEPFVLAQRLMEMGVDWPLALMCLDLYEEYQRSLSYRGAVDFQDLMKYALNALDADPEFLARLQHRWPYILEDEAQDSSQLQDEMLRRLAGGSGNWVRVGDPNQAIYTTFTTADPEILRGFLAEPGVESLPLPQSGRSARPIIALANALADWTEDKHPSEAMRDTFSRPRIEAVDDPADEQPNPEECFIYFDYQPSKNMTPEEELKRVAGSLERWLPDHKDWTVAVLVPENSRGFQLAETLRERDIDYEELLRSSSATRTAARVLQLTLDLLADPTRSRNLADVYQHVWWSLHLGREADIALAEQVVGEMHSLRQVEDFLWPGAEGDWLDTLALVENVPVLGDDLRAFRQQVTRWLLASNLPVDQIVLTIAQDLFTDEARDADIALAHKIAVVLRGISLNNPEYRLPQFSQELRAIANNERRFLGFDAAETGYEPSPGVVTIATMHAAKGLEWDRVYIMALNNYSFPSVQEHDTYMSELWFVRDNLNLEAEALAQLDAIGDDTLTYDEAQPSRAARIDFARERLRLLYVGITRARKDLILLWNVGRFWERGGDSVKQPAAPFVALYSMDDIWKKEETS